MVKCGTQKRVELLGHAQLGGPDAVVIVWKENDHLVLLCLLNDQTLPRHTVLYLGHWYRIFMKGPKKD